MSRTNTMHFCFLAVLATMLLAAGGCKKEQVGPPPRMEIEYSVTDASFFNADDGAIDVSLSGVEGPFQYFWSTGDTTRDLSGLYAGDYTLNVTFGEEGYSEITASVSQPDPEPLDLQFDIIDVSRYGKSDGSVSLTVSGGTAPYSPVWEGSDTTFHYTGLEAGTYHVVVTDASSPYQIATEGTVEVTEPDFVCGVDSIADVDGNLYPTVLIGDQCWFSENLRTLHLPADPASPIEGRFCAGNFCFNQEGAHYTWEGMMNGETADPEDPYAMVQGICPDGWYLPTRKTFQDLDSVLSIPGNYGDGNFPGTKMKGEDSSSGFDALFTGNWGYGIYKNDQIASFWSSSEFFTGGSDISGEAYYFLLTEDTPFLSSGHKPKSYGMNVRCMKRLED